MAKASAKGATKTKPAAKGRKRSRTIAASYTSLVVEVRNGVALLALARPDVRNAFDDTLIAEFTTALRELDADDAVRAVVLLGHGPSFCAGADLNWMKKMAALWPRRESR